MSTNAILKKRAKATAAAVQREVDAAAAHFRETVLAEPCLFALRRWEGGEHICEGQRDAHHVIEAQFLRYYYGAIPEWWKRVYDPAIGVTLCRGAHDLITVHAEHIYFDELPARCVDWAESRGLRHRLERECPHRGAGI